MELGAIGSLKLTTNVTGDGDVRKPPTGGLVVVTVSAGLSYRNVAEKPVIPPSALAMAPAAMAIVCTPWFTTGLAANVNVALVLVASNVTSVAATPFTVKSLACSVAGL